MNQQARELFAQFDCLHRVEEAFFKSTKTVFKTRYVVLLVKSPFFFNFLKGTEILPKSAGSKIAENRTVDMVSMDLF